MDYKLEPISSEDRKSVIDIFNHYAENSFAAYLESKVPYEFFDMMIMEMSLGYPDVTAKDASDRVVGFGMLRPHHPMPAFSRASEISYFILPEWTRKGIGRSILEYLIEGAKEMGITTILASISSLNEGSLAFHRKNGFQECGRFKEIGMKKGRSFDVIWMQRML